MSRLTVDITDRQHQSLKAMAALEGKSIKQYALERLFPVSPVDDEAWNELKALGNRRISNGLAGALSSKTIEAIVAEELDSESRA